MGKFAQRTQAVKPPALRLTNKIIMIFHVARPAIVTHFEETRETSTLRSCQPGAHVSRDIVWTQDDGNFK
jgi:hypothetical protein